MGVKRIFHTVPVAGGETGVPGGEYAGASRFVILAAWDA